VTTLGPEAAATGGPGRADPGAQDRHAAALGEGHSESAGLDRPALADVDWEQTLAIVPSFSGFPSGYARKEGIHHDHDEVRWTRRRRLGRWGSQCPPAGHTQQRFHKC